MCIRDSIGIATINRPEALNALNATVISELEQVITEVEKDAELGAFIITGEGRSFVEMCIRDRLNVIRIHIPPLRQRKEDIFPLAHQFLARFCGEYGKSLTFSPRFLNFLERYDWPGNVRQLENLIERLVIIVQDPIIDVTALPQEYTGDAVPPPAAVLESSGTLAERMDAYEGQILSLIHI